jgi:glycosyltransferase involved in cell wall biosynthesis
LANQLQKEDSLKKALEQPYLSVVIPAYNEAKNFGKGVLNQVDIYLSDRPYSFEVIIVDDGSKDETVSRVNKFTKVRNNWKLIENSHQGKAQAVKKGIENSQGKYVLFTDFDQATPISEIEKLLPFMEKGYSIAIGSREVKGSKREREPWYRHLMGRGWNLFVQALALPGIHDTQCGFKLFKTSIAKDLFSSLKVYRNGMEKNAFTGAFDVELLFIAQKRNLQIAEVPVHWKHVYTTRVDPIRDSIRMAVDLIRIRLVDLEGGYEKVG